MSDSIYDKVYRKANPNPAPHSPFSIQPELWRLWPSKQEEFRKIVDATTTTVEVIDDE